MTTLINGRPVHSEEVVKIYTIEPAGHIDPRLAENGRIGWVLLIGLIWALTLWSLNCWSYGGEN